MFGMQRVIAGYDSFEQAKQAVRSLEPHFSIQDVVIADECQTLWRKLHPERDDTRRTMPFLVVMAGEPDAIQRARALLLMHPPPPAAR